MQPDRPAIIVISSHVVRGTVGNRAATLALELLGFPVWSIPTVTLPWHPGHISKAGIPRRLQPDDDAFCAMLDDLANAPWIGEVGAVLTGYFASVRQIEAAALLVQHLKQKDPAVCYLLDPVIGDEQGGTGKLFVPEDNADAIRNSLLPLADIITPNLFELSWLSNRPDLANFTDIEEAAISLAVATALVTSVPALRTGHIANLLTHDNNCFLAEHRQAKGPSNGLGDLMSALWLGNWLLRESTGKQIENIFAKTCASVQDVLLHSAQMGSDELLLEQAQLSLHRPRSRVDSRVLLKPTGSTP